MTPPTARTWARRGRTPVIRVRGRSQRRFSIAALACYKHGERSRLIYRPVRHLDHKRGGRRSFTWTDYRDLLTAAHQQLGAPIVLVSDHLNGHTHPD
ncbi:IS630 family transposase, partial [Streptomyces sp. NPDC059468]